MKEKCNGSIAFYIYISCEYFLSIDLLHYKLCICPYGCCYFFLFMHTNLEVKIHSLSLIDRVIVSAVLDT